jgi:hypothetical protein
MQFQVVFIVFTVFIIFTTSLSFVSFIHVNVLLIKLIMGRDIFEESFILINLGVL